MSARRHRVDRDDLVVVDGRKLRLARATRMALTFDAIGEPEVKVRLSHAEFVEATRRKGYRRVPGHFAKGRSEAEEEAGVERLDRVPKRELPALRARHRWVIGYLEFEKAGVAARSDNSMAIAVERIAESIREERVARANGGAKPRKAQFNSKPVADAPDQPVTRPSVKTLLRWIKRFERGGRTILALRYGHHRSGNRERRLEPEMIEVARTAARGYMSAQRPTKATCLRAMRTAAKELNAARAAKGLAPLRIPTRRVLYAEIEALPKAMVCAARMGPDEAASLFGPLGAGLGVQRPGQRIQMDEWEVHAETLLAEAGLLEGLDAEWRRTAARHRVVVCEAIDAATGLTMGLSCADAANTTANAMACLSMVFVDKTRLARWAGATSRWDMCCSPEEVVTDGGAGFTSDQFQCAVTDLLGDKATTPAGVAPLRARIERAFLTKEQRLMPMVAGRTFLNPIDKGDYDSHARAAILDVVLRKLLIIDAVDVCHNSPNTGRLRGATPLDAWDALCGTYGVYPPPGVEDRRNALGCKMERLTGRHGVRVLNLDYTSEELQRRFRREGARTVTVSVDPADLGEVSVLTDEGWLSCGCRQRAMDGVPMDVWVAAEADLRRRNAARAALSEQVVLDAIRRMRELVASAEAQFGLGGACPSAEELDRVEARMLISFPPRKADPAHVGADPLGSAVPRGTPVEPYAVMDGDGHVAPGSEAVPDAPHEVLDEEADGGLGEGWVAHGDDLRAEGGGEVAAGDAGDDVGEVPPPDATAREAAVPEPPSEADAFTPGIEEHDDHDH